MPRKSQVIQGLEALNKRMTDLDFIQIPTGPFLRDWRDTFRDKAFDLAPEWSGDTKKSIKSNQDTARFPLFARVFSDEPQARWMEFGTGLLSEDPDSAHERYFPSVEGVREWAEYYNLDPYTVALGIFMNGGTAPRHFFRDASEYSKDQMNVKLGRYGAAIGAQAEKRR